jgi:hypothetical protein
MSSRRSEEKARSGALFGVVDVAEAPNGRGI